MICNSSFLKILSYFLQSLKCISSINGDALKIIKKAIESSEGKGEFKEEGLNVLNQK